MHSLGKLGRPPIIPTNPLVNVSYWKRPSTVPIAKGESGLNYVVVSAGHDHACASLGVSGFNPTTFAISGKGLMVQCWGGNDLAQLLDGTTNSSYLPTTATHSRLWHSARVNPALTST